MRIIYKSTALKNFLLALMILQQILMAHILNKLTTSV